MQEQGRVISQSDYGRRNHRSFDAREGIEVTAIRIAAEKGISETRLIELERINRNMEDANIAGRIKENFEADQQFHDYLVNLSRNKN